MDLVNPSLLADRIAVLTARVSKPVSRVDGRGDVASRRNLVPTRNLLLAALPAVDSKKIIASSKLVDLSSGGMVYEANGAIEDIYFPINSIVSAFAILEDGSTVEISMTGREGLVGLPALVGGGLSPHWTQVSVGGAALRIPKSVLQEYSRKDEAVYKAILNAYSYLFTQICQRSVCNVRHTLLQRLCVWLLMVHDRLESPELPFTQEDIAARISVRRAGVSVAASSLQEVRAISYHRGRIVINERAALEMTACECYRVLRQEFEKPENHSDRGVTR